MFSSAGAAKRLAKHIDLSISSSSYICKREKSSLAEWPFLAEKRYKKVFSLKRMNKV